MASSRKLIEKVSARVFCHGPGGGNPVTVYHTPEPLSHQLQQKLAKECDWESVMISRRESSPEMAFYMPSGLEVSFCAHAAIGAAFTTSSKPDEDFAFRNQMDNHLYQAFVSQKKSLASLFMDTRWTEQPVTHPPSLHRLMREYLRLPSHYLAQRGKPLPTFVNASIARPKTLVHVNDVEGLRAMRPPSLDSVESSKAWSVACQAIDDSTGIYAYAQSEDEDGAWECRQFPQASGYAEDPATGIAAAALATSLYMDANYFDTYKFYQGISMGRPSLIEVTDLKIVNDGVVSFCLQGRVEIDDRQTIEVDE